MNPASQHLLGLPQLHQKPLAKALREQTAGAENAIFSNALAAILSVMPASGTAQDTPGPQLAATALSGQKGGFGTIKAVSDRPVAATISAQSGKETPPSGQSDGKDLPLHSDNDAPPIRLGAGAAVELASVSPPGTAERVSGAQPPQTLVISAVVPNSVNEPSAEATIETSARVEASGIFAQRGGDSGQASDIRLSAEANTTQPNRTQISNPVQGKASEITENTLPRVHDGGRQSERALDNNPLITQRVSEQTSAQKPAEQILGVSNALRSGTVFPQTFESGPPVNTPRHQTASGQVVAIRPDSLATAFTNPLDKPVANNPLPLAEVLSPASVQTPSVITENGAARQALAVGGPATPVRHPQGTSEGLERVDEPFNPAVTKISLSPKSDLSLPSQAMSSKFVNPDLAAVSVEGVGELGTDDGAGANTNPSQTAPSLGNPVTTARNPAAASFASMQFSDPQFQRNFNDHVLLMAGQGVQKAHLSLNPQELGPVEIRLAMQNDEVSIQLASTNAAVREALEQALPRLREMFEQTGLKLVDQQVAGQFSDQGAGRSFMQESQREQQLFTEFGETRDLNAGESAPRRSASGLVDTYI